MSKRPLDGLRVADFSWFGAGPIAGQTLCTFGAEVVRVESLAKVDSLRVAHPFATNSDGGLRAATTSPATSTTSTRASFRSN